MLMQAMIKIQSNMKSDAEQQYMVLDEFKESYMITTKGEIDELKEVIEGQKEEIDALTDAIKRYTEDFQEEMADCRTKNFEQTTTVERMLEDHRTDMLEEFIPIKEGDELQRQIDGLRKEISQLGQKTGNVSTESVS